MKKVFAAFVAVILVFTFAGCGDQSSKSKYTVGVCQLVQHPALDKATEGFRDALKAELGDDVAILEQNASGEQNACTTIVNGYVSQKVDLIMANATPALQAAASATNTIPILGTAVTHYAPALDISIEDWTGTVGGNISGTSDLANLQAQALMVRDWFPEAKNVAIVYCSSEANSIFQAQEVEKTFAKMDIETKEFTFTDSNDVASVVQNACNFADVLYIPTDNVAASNAEAIANVVIENKKPVVAGEKELCAKCGVAALSIDYYDLGVTTGKMAAKILKGEAKVEEMAIEYAPYSNFYNEEMCKTLGITPLEGYAKIE